ncbi:hypothetical protein LCGC14_2761690, partial [marine sediment metagenome]
MAMEAAGGCSLFAVLQVDGALVAGTYRTGDYAFWA